MRLAYSTNSEPATAPISPLLELGAYEAMWLKEEGIGQKDVKKIADRFAADPSALPSDFIPCAVAHQCAREVVAKLKAEGAVYRP
jgi:DNA processing protein